MGYLPSLSSALKRLDDAVRSLEASVVKLRNIEPSEDSEIATRLNEIEEEVDSLISTLTSAATESPSSSKPKGG